MDELLSDFIAETRETLEALADELAAWETDPADRARLDAIFRFVHTIKGSCGFLDLPRLERLSHAAEGALAEVRAGTRAPDRALIDAVLAVIGRIRELVDVIDTGEPLPDGDDRLLIAALAPGAASAPRVPPIRPARANPRSIRVPADLFDRMMASISELVLARDEIARRMRDASGGAAAETAFERLSLTLGELRDTIARARTARLDHLFARLPGMVRDLAAGLGREVALVVDGGDVVLDRETIDMIRDPLTHIIRNALDHGIEPPAERIAAGKPRRGRLAVSARRAGNEILIEIADDGRGIDVDRLVARAVAAGIVTPAQARAMPPARRLELILAPGLSTAREVTNVSGRGVGMDVVRDNLARIGGVVELDSRPGEGLRLQLRVPLTLTIVPALTGTPAGRMFAISPAAVHDREELVIGPAARAVPTTGRDAGAALPGGDRPPLPLDPGGPAAAARLPATSPANEESVADFATATPPASFRALLFRARGGSERAIRLALVARIEDVAASRVTFAAGRHWLGLGDAVLPLFGAEVASDRARVLIVRMTDGTTTLAYAIDAVIDFVTVHGAITPALAPGPIAGVVRIDGRTVELLDPHWLFAAVATAPPAGRRPLALLMDDDSGMSSIWAREVLRPLVEAAGYAVAFAGEDGAARADVVLAKVGTDVGACPGAPVVRLRDEQAHADDSASVWRYDRAALTAALRRLRGGGGS